LIGGIRVEHDQNNYTAKMLFGGITNFGIIRRPSGIIKDTTTNYIETNFLPNLQLAVRPTDFLTVRFAAYKALARPDYNLRLPRFQPVVLTFQPPMGILN